MVDGVCKQESSQASVRKLDPLLHDQQQRMLVVRKRWKARNHGGAGTGIGMGTEAARPIMKRSRAISS